MIIFIYKKKVKMLVTNDHGNIVMFQRAKKPGQKSTKVQLLLWFHFSTDNFNCFFFQSTRKMVGKDEMIYTMEVVGQVGCNDQVGQPEVVCVQKFKRIA